MLREQEQEQVDGGEAQDSSLDRRRFLGKVGAAGLGAGALAVGAGMARAAERRWGRSRHRPRSAARRAISGRMVRRPPISGTRT